MSTPKTLAERWFPVAMGRREHGKIMRAARLMQVDTYWVMGVTEALYSWAIDAAPTGRIDRETLVALLSAWCPTHNPDTIVDALISCGTPGRPGLIEDHNDHLTLHQWEDYAGARLEKLARERDRSKSRRVNTKQQPTAVGPRSDHGITAARPGPYDIQTYQTDIPLPRAHGRATERPEDFVQPQSNTEQSVKILPPTPSRPVEPVSLVHPDEPDREHPILRPYGWAELWAATDKRTKRAEALAEWQGFGFDYQTARWAARALHEFIEEEWPQPSSLHPTVADYIRNRQWESVEIAPITCPATHEAIEAIREREADEWRYQTKRGGQRAADAWWLKREAVLELTDHGGHLLYPGHWSEAHGWTRTEVDAGSRWEPPPGHTKPPPPVAPAPKTAAKRVAGGLDLGPKRNMAMIERW